MPELKSFNIFIWFSIVIAVWVLYVLYIVIGKFFARKILEPVEFYTDYVPLERNGVGEWLVNLRIDNEILFDLFWIPLFIVWIIELIIVSPWIIIGLPDAKKNPLTNIGAQIIKKKQQGGN